MKIEIKKWEVERIKSIVSDILELYAHDRVEAQDSSSGASISMSKDLFLESLERDLMDSNK